MSIFLNSKNSNATLVNVGDGAHRDSFERLRVSQPETLFESVLNKSPQVHYWSTVVSGTGKVEWQSLRASNYLTVDTDAGALSYNQTKQNFHYQPGKSLLTIMTFVMAPAKENLVQRVGYFNNKAGMFLQLDGTQLSVVARTYLTGSVEESVINQEDWNIDKLDGEGPRGVIVDIANIQIFVVDFQWLGAGRVRFGFFFSGELIYFHEIFHSNIFNNVFLNTPDLPCRYEIENKGITSSPSILEQVCCTVISEGGHNPRGFIKGVDTSSTPVSVPSSQLRPLLSIRLQEGTNSTLIPLNYSVISTSNSDVLIRFILNGELTGADWNSVPGIESVSELDTSSTTISGGEVISSEYANNSVKGGFDIPLQGESWMFLATTASGVRDVLTIAAQSRISTANVSASLNYKEIA